MTSEVSRLRIGAGRDLHGLFKGFPLVLGGVDIPSEVGFSTHSDGDVLCHALIDALAGAMADGDLGTHFPEEDPDAEDARSLDFVTQFSAYTRSRGFEIVNVDAFVTIGTVRLRPHIEKMRANVAAALGVPLTRVSVKARSNDGMGLAGEGVAVEAWAHVLVLAPP